MLVIAIPKSASTSLRRTLGKVHKLETIQNDDIRINEIPKESRIIHKYHHDMRELTRKDVDPFDSLDVFYKQHIFPSKNNMELLKKVKKVILLRDTKEIIQAYRRGAIAKTHVLLSNFSRSYNEEMWMKQAKKVGLYQDLECFNNRWKSLENDGYTLIINYKDLINSTNAVFNKIEAFWGLKKTTEKINLLKEGYSRRSPFYNELKHLAFLTLDKLHMYHFAKSVQRRLQGISNA